MSGDMPRMGSHPAIKYIQNHVMNHPYEKIVVKEPSTDADIHISALESRWSFCKIGNVFLSN